MEPNILKIDLDEPKRFKAVDFIKKRLCYCHDIGFLNIPDVIDKIQLIKKSNYSVKIFLKCKFKPDWIVILQLILGSDYRKEVNTLINHHRLKMSYSNRLFDLKKYKDGSIKKSKITDITREVITHVENKDRDYYYN